MSKSIFHNPNISLSANNNTYWYDYNYDELNRLIQADYVRGGDSLNINAFDLRGLQYDAASNITQLRRRKENGSWIDDLDYTYQSGTNRLANLTDAVATTSESWDAEDVASFGYDPNGNMTSQSGKFTDIAYDHRNLPTHFDLDGGGDVRAFYNGDGQRILKEQSASSYSFYVMDGQQTLAVIKDGTLSHMNLVGNSTFGRLDADGSGNISTGGARKYYITDHLGSTRAVSNDSGTILETFDYYPFGLLMPKRNTASGNTLEKFTGKELDEETNLFHFGAHVYDPAIARWNGVDPSADQYPSLSPYNYAANNPLFFVDPNGKEIWIHYQDEEGEEQRLRYEVGLDYDGDNEFVQNTVSLLNEIGSVEHGGAVLGKLVSSENKFNFLNQSPSGPSEKGHLGGFSFRPNEGGGGNILAGDISKIGRGQAVNSLAHEGFHAYQSEFGLRRGSVNAEVGAYLFGDGTSLSLGYPTAGGGLANNSRAAQAYSNAFRNLLGGDQFSLSAYKVAITNFKQGSAANSLGLYNNVPVLPINPTPPISKLYPLIRY